MGKVEMGWGGRREGDSGWGIHVHPWLIHVNVWQKPPQYCKIISLQLKFKKNFFKEMAKESAPISKGLQFLLETDTLKQP